MSADQNALAELVPTARMAMLEALLETLPDAVVQTDGQWRITYLNPAWKTQTGHAVADALGRSLLDFVHPEDAGMLKSGLPVFRLRLVNADYRWMRLVLQAASDAQGRVTSRNGVLSEIADSTQKVMIEVRQRFLRLLETIDGVVWEAERGVGNTFLSAQVERLFGFSTEEWRADPNFWRSRLHPDDYSQALAIDEAAYNASHSYAYEMNYRLLDKSGKAIWVRDLCRVIVEVGQPTRMIGLMIDVSQHKQTELDLARSENRYALAARGSNDGIWDWDVQADELHVSARFHQILGLPATAQLYRGGWKFLHTLIHPDELERVQAAYQQHLSGEITNFSVDFRARNVRGNYIWVNWRGVAEMADSRPARMAGSFSDLAERGSFYDPLTNLPGRPLLRDRLEQAIKSYSGVRTMTDHSLQVATHQRQGFSLLLLDLDRFKAINDRLGHHIGDQLLQQVARRLERCVRSGDLVARMSGDEFIVLLEALAPEEASAIAELIARALAAPYELSPHQVHSAASIGLVHSIARLDSVDAFLHAADAAMYSAKQGKGGVAVWSTV